MKLIIIRHGDPDYEHDSLTETGVIEAKLLAGRLAQHKNIAAFYVSPLGRAQATAQYTLDALHRTVGLAPAGMDGRAALLRQGQMGGDGDHAGIRRRCGGAARL